MINKREQKVIFIILVIVSLILSFPIFFSILISLSENKDIIQGSYFTGNLSFENYFRLFNRLPMGSYILNSFINSTIITVAHIVIGILAAYFFVFLNFKGKNIIFSIFLMTMMMPIEILIVRNFKTIRELGLLNTFSGLALPSLASTFGIFLLRQNMKQIPKELYEASKIIGVSDRSFLIHVVIPMVRNSILTLGMYSFLTSWNAYLWPLVSTTENTVKTAQLGLRDLSAPDVLTDYSLIASGAIIVAIPTLFLIVFGQTKLEEGLSKGSIK